MKNYLVLISLCFTAGCSLFQKDDCIHNENYVMVNKEKLENYSHNISLKNKTSLYIEHQPAKPCIENSCLYFDSNKFNFIERYFDDSERKGIYHITESKNTNDRNCIILSLFENNKFVDRCFKITKNKLNEKTAEYNLIFDNRLNWLQKISFRTKDGLLIYEVSNQPEANKFNDNYGLSFCSYPYRIYPELKFNPIYFPQHGRIN